MPSPSLRLLWKEWRERRRDLALWTLCVAGCAAYVAISEWRHASRTPVGRYFAICSFFSVLAAILFAVKTSLRETTERTIGFSMALPFSPRSFARRRLTGAVVVLAGPILLGAALLSIPLMAGVFEQVPPRPAATPFGDVADRSSLPAGAAGILLWKTTAIVVVQAVEFLLILSVIGVRRRTEAQVGFLGVIGGIIWLHLGEAHDLAGRFEWPATFGWLATFDWLAGAIPQSLAIAREYGDSRGTGVDLSIAGRLWGPLALNGLMLAGLAFAFSMRYGTRRILPAESPSGWPRWQFPFLLARVPKCVPGRIGALLWLNLRYALPAAAAGLVLAYLVTAVNLVLYGPRFNLPLFLAVAGHLPGTVAWLGMLWGTVVAAGLFAPELQPGLEGFWRSRPIPPGTWFWTKYLTGLAVTLGMLDGATIIASWNSPFVPVPERMSVSYIACLPVLHGLLYSLTVLSVCRVRRPILAAGMALAASAIALSAVASILPLSRFEPFAVYYRLLDAEQAGGIDLMACDYPLVYGGMAAVALGAAVCAARLLGRTERA